MRIGDLGGPEIILIVLALVLVFGAGKLGDIGGALGKSVREFKRATHDEATATAQTDPVQGAPTVPTPTATVAVERPLTTGAPVADYRPTAGRA